MALQLSRWSRRRLLQAAGVGALGSALAPFIPRSIAAPGPKRIIFISNGQGTDMTRWRPTGTESDFTLSGPLEPLAGYQDRMLVLDGVDNEAVYHGVITGHFGMGTLWTGVGLPEGTVRPEGCGWPQAPSVDRIIAERIGQDTRFDAFYWGTWPIAVDGSNQGPNGISHYRGPDEPIDPELSPFRAFDRLFDGVTGDSETAKKIRAERQSVIDLVRGELGRVRAEMPEFDRDRFDAHLDGIRKLEERLGELGAQCVVPPAPTDYSEDELRNFDLHATLTRLQFGLMNVALACDLTRVACFEWPHSEGYGQFMEAEGYRAFGSFHTVAHTMSYADLDGYVPSDDERAIAREDMANLTHWRSKMIATELLDMMAPDILANTVLVWAAEMSEGGTHSNRNIPVVIVQGSDVGHFQTGRYLRWGSYDPISNFSDYTGGKPMNQVLVSLCHSMGLEDVTSVGDASISTGPLEELT
jgi:hypothetical protein